MNHLLYKTVNSGSNWVTIGNFTEAVYAINFLNENTGWIGLSGGKIANTTNSGINWAIQQPFNRPENVRHFYFYNNVGWAGNRMVE